MNKRTSLLWFLPLIVLIAMLVGQTGIAEAGLNGSLGRLENLNVILDEASPPTINIWYGSTQNFGYRGMPQRQINILGNVTDPDDTNPEEVEIVSLSYTLNDGDPKNLSMGPDTRRLLKKGDFNVELFDDELSVGVNTLLITAEDKDGLTTTSEVTVNYKRDQFWPLPTTHSWTASSMHNEAQVVDGKWTVAGDGSVGTVDVGYDRLIAIGDLSWKNYEVTVPFKIHSVDAAGYNPISTNPGVGLLLHWVGNTDEPPFEGWQPTTGWRPFGALAWYSYTEDANGNRLQILDDQSQVLAQDLSGKTLNLETSYMIKVRAETISGGVPEYRLKVWAATNPEPSAWDLIGQGEPGGHNYGSLLLFAHHVDVSFGAVNVVPIGDSPPASTIVSDDFNKCELDTSLWSFVNPVGDATVSVSGAFTGNAHLNINVPSGVDHNLYPSNKSARIMQPVNNTDFKVEAKFVSGVSQKYQMQGILFEEDEDTFLRFDFYSDSEDTIFFISGYDGGDTYEMSNAAVLPNGQAPLYMRVSRTGSRWVVWYSTNGTSWIPYNSFDFSLEVEKVGVFTGNAIGAISPLHEMSLDYFQNLDAPLIGEDAGQNTLTANVSGSGSVMRQPEKSSYSCGEQVQVTANANPGWSFHHWTGALTGTANPATVTMNGPKVITAHFMEDVTLTINKVGSGTVTVVPEKAAYKYGEVVTLTATGDTGLAFANWSGDLTGSTNPIQLTMDGNKTVTANFTQDQYTLTVNTVGNGSVTVIPDKAVYTAGEVVTLTATPVGDWQFAGWGGALSGSTNPAQLTMNSSKVVTATFLPLGPIEHKIFMSWVIK
jgi:hypothetical protein